MIEGLSLALAIYLSQKIGKKNINWINGTLLSIATATITAALYWTLQVFVYHFFTTEQGYVEKATIASLVRGTFYYPILCIGLYAYFRQSHKKNVGAIVVNEEDSKTIKPNPFKDNNHNPSQLEEISPKNNEEVFWENALTEYDGLDRKNGLWAKCFSESQGDEARTKALYLQERVKQFKQGSSSKDSEHKSLKSITKSSENPIDFIEQHKQKNTTTQKINPSEKLLLDELILMGCKITEKPTHWEIIKDNHVFSANSIEDLERILIDLT